MKTAAIRNINIAFKKEPLKTEKGKYFFLGTGDLKILRESGNTPVNNLKNFFKKSPSLYFILQACLYPVLFINGKTRKDFLKIDPEKKVIVNIGSGNNTEDNIVNLDIFPFKKVDIVADAHDLPFEDNSIDKIIIEASIEHVSDPNKVIGEIHRVLKPQGLIFIVSPFIQGYHDSPSDYWRWTKEGLKMLLKEFEIVEIGNKGGIASALGWVLAEFTATALSFGIKPLHFIFFHAALIFLMPLKLLDFLFVYYPTASNISSLFYAIARKR